MTSKILPSIAEFLSNVLGQKLEEYLNHWVLDDVKKLDLAIAEGHSLALQKRLDAFKEAFSINVRRAKALSNPPSKPLRLDEIEIDTACPVCKTKLNAYWDFEADFDEYGPIGAYPVTLMQSLYFAATVASMWKEWILVSTYPKASTSTSKMRIGVPTTCGRRQPTYSDKYSESAQHADGVDAFSSLFRSCEGATHPRRYADHPE